MVPSFLWKATPTDRKVFMHYVHTEDKLVRDAAELVASRRKSVVAGRPIAVAESTAMT
ncbi:MAG: hypothetical protein KIS79_11260 [Burkholderiales bacterium]|nr:hypothetical protein [Burkholderiales bacterium]